MRTIAVLAWVSGMLAAATLPGAEPAAARPNVVIIIADDMAWDDCGAFGHPHIRTPHLDRLAKEGMRFERAFLTCSSCSPSRASILTGRYPHATGAPELHMPVPAEQVLLSTPLREAGYFTAALGKWHLGPHVVAQFDVVKQGGGPAGYDHWIPTLRQRPKDKPFFFWLATTDPHRPYQPNTIAQPHTPDDAVVPPYLPDLPETRQDLAQYYDEIGRLDAHVGEVLAELEAQGVAENTLVVFLSDNGRPFPRCKTTVYDSGIRTPLIVRWPRGVRPGQVTRSIVSSVDLAPTILELAGLPPFERFQGTSFAKILRDPQAQTRTYAFAEHNWHDYMAFERAVRSARFTYLRNEVPEVPATPPADAVRSPTFQAMRRLRDEGRLPPHQRGCFLVPRPTEELYDLEADPFALNNVAEDPQYAETLAEMRKVLADWQKETGDAKPKKLTPDKFDRETGLPLNAPRRGRKAEPEPRAPAKSKPTAGQAAAPKRPPNFILLMADDLGAKELGCYGNAEHRTPNLDTLARSGVQFQTCFAATICHPTRVMIMTGQYGCHNGVYNFAGRRGGPDPQSPAEDMANHVTFAQVLRTRGYATAMAGKWQLSGKLPTLVRECGFDEYCMWAYDHNLPEGVVHPAREDKTKPSRYWHPSIVQNGEYRPTEPDDYGPDLFTDFVIDFARRHRDRPFFIYYPMCLTHAPYYPTPDSLRPGEEKFRHARENFKANVEYMDKLVGRIVRALEEMGLRDETIVFFTADNGTGGQGKGQPTELGARVPMIVNAPGIVRPLGESEVLVDLSDVLPTLADFAGAALPKDRIIDGRSFAPTLRGEPGPTREWIFSFIGDRRILRTRRWLLEDNSPLHYGRLYDCGDRRDGTGYKDVTDSADPEVLAVRKAFDAILADLPAPVLPEDGPAAATIKRAKAKRKAKK